MSLNPSKQTVKRMSSITKKIHKIWIKERIRRQIASDIMLFVVLYISAILLNAYIGYGDDMLKHYHSVFGDSAFISGTQLTSETLEELMWSGRMYMFIRYIGLAMSFVVLAQVTGLTLGYSSRIKRISKILNPINEIAIKADELSRMSFDEDKYRILEDAIDNIQPGEDNRLNINNEDLKGVEAAMNNLLVRIRESNQQQARFVNDASHELRTPIAVIEGYANMLSRWGKEDEAVLDESITAIKNESAHMKYLVEQLLFLARGDSGKTEIKSETVSLSELMKEIYEESLMIDEKHQYKYKTTGDEVKTIADPGLLKQAIRILVDNAAKYTNEGDEIILSVGTDENSFCYMQVQDTGIGMEKADVEHMFDRFYRADKARNTEGTGLGLSIAKWIVDKHKGHFEITSVTELGTRIRIVIP